MHSVIMNFGFAILIVAVILNMIANYLGISTWYSFLSNLKDFKYYLNKLK